ncbi:hypothetical protein TREMEDRAFT_66876 [Tremella mesenterica DSM 1558]|uniref:uncharacterized protein n=1 Tax=Tremella mesenterica (strain ATCC 24925 / CBS 8224 / DSM 1558 / NBRC 9311 / NRRL Y-6157 / RJB 2259-6 / UBC 559-6) TaxID=578456 RepID=UPI0003F4A3EE|nr:uncharacterized protein TREMEDRAFT_66876 [Tremella mesenterica DSM 1558]EIW72406.1 hypothetical protein TREMEDRAFT_66876 [Tremella mesenterica DSM 1558]
MGLSERKVKQRIGLDPRNLSWSNDQSRFSYKHMTALGWKESSGLGSDLGGNPNHIAVVRRLDNSGIGTSRARKEGEDNAAGAGVAGRGLDDVLKRLQAASESSTPSPAPEVAEKVPAPVKSRIASRQKHLHAKRLASSSPAALAEILGVPISSLPTSITTTPTTTSPPTPVSEPLTVSEEEIDGRKVTETTSTSSLSVADYFRQKLREKMLARQANTNTASSSTPSTNDLAENSLARIKEEVKVAVGGVSWEGSKTTFAENAKVLVEETKVQAFQEVITLVSDTKQERRRRKEEKRARKADKLAKKTANISSVEVTPSVRKEKKRKRETGDTVEIEATEEWDNINEPAEMRKKKRKEKKKREIVDDTTA